MLEIKAVRMEFPEDANIIVGQSHFIKTVEDLYEAVCTAVPQAKFGLAFNESSGACLTRADGNQEALREIAIRNAQALGCGHTFVLVIQNAYPINVLNAIRNRGAERARPGRARCDCDGCSPNGIETPSDVTWRHDLLRKIGYKR